MSLSRALKPAAEARITRTTSKLKLIPSMNTTQTPPSTRVHIGVDVCAAWLDIHGLPRPERLANTTTGHARLIKQLQCLPEAAHVILEASGGHEHALWLALLRTGIATSRVNPARVRHFARAHGILAKTDKIDAALLTRFGQQVQPACDVLPQDWELELRELSDRRLQLVSVRAQQMVQKQQLRDKRLVTQAASLLKTLDKQVKLLDQRIAALLEQGEAAIKAQRLRQMSGVGKTVSATLLSELPELGKVNDSRLSSLAGLAPHPHDSGPMKGTRHIQGGRHKVRRVLYMAALHCVRSNTILKTFYQNLLKRGKPFKVAITAVMRKLLCVLNKLAANPSFQLAH